MRSRKLLLMMIAAASVLGAARAASADGPKYLCVDDKAVGFSRNEATGTWKGREGISEDKYILRPRTEEDFGTTPYVVFKLGSSLETLPNYFCDQTVEEVVEKDFDPKDEVLRCEGLSGLFWFNPNTMRFQTMYPQGYLGDHKADEPHITIGGCSRL